MIAKPLSVRLAAIAGVNLLSAFTSAFYCGVAALLISDAAPVFERQALNVLVVAAVFTAPILLAGFPAQFLNTRFSTRNVILFVKAGEVLLGGAAAICWQGFRPGDSRLPLFAVAALLGAGYSIYRPALKCFSAAALPRRSLSWASALTECATFLGIVVGTVCAVTGWRLVSGLSEPPAILGGVMTAVAFYSLILASRLDPVPPHQHRVAFTDLPRQWLDSLRRQPRYRELVLTGIGESYVFGAIILAASMAIHYAGLRLDYGSGSEVQLYSIMASPVIGAALGCLVGGWLSGRNVELGLVPGAVLAVTAVGILTATLPVWADRYIESGLLALLLGAFGFGAGIMLVPVQAWQIYFVKPALRPAFFSWFYVPFALGILGATAIVFCMYFLNWRIFAVTFAVALLTFALGCVTFFFMPQFLLRMLMLILLRTLYRLRIFHAERIPEEGPALLVANRASFVDMLFISACTTRPVRFMLHESYFRYPPLYPLYRSVGFLEVPSGKPKKLRKLFLRTRRHLRNGELICIFPEGDITRNGVMSSFRGGMSMMLPERADGEADVPIIPMRIGMTWGSIFSCYYGKFKLRWPVEFPHPASVTVGEPLPRDTTAYEMLIKLSELAAETELIPAAQERPYHVQFAFLARRAPFGHLIREYSGSEWNEPGNFVQFFRILLLSRFLRRICDDDEEYIGVMLPNGIAAAGCITAVLCADRVPAILNYTASREALDRAIEKASLSHILTSRAFLERLGMAPRPEMVFLEDAAASGFIPPPAKLMWLAAALLLPTGELMRLASPESCNDVQREAVVIFSSGSTGIPKGVLLTHHNLTADVTSIIKVIGWSKRDRILGNLPLFHSFGLAVCLWMPVISGAETTMIPNVLDGNAAGEVMTRRKVTVLVATPGFMQIYMRKCAPESFRSLRLAITGAEKLREDILSRFYKMTGLTIAEGYGCSELSPVVSINLANSLMELGATVAEPGSIGPPLPGVCAKIVDPATFELLPEDTDGLMIVKGAIVMKGYLGDPEKTAEVIRDRWYITGDIARMNRNGFITITGRISRFSKIAGEMVPHELVERELNAILLPDDRLLAVCGAADAKRGEKLLVLYTDPARLDPAAVIAEMRRRGLPNLWIPRPENFIVVPEIPVLGSGKLDLARLAEIANRHADTPHIPAAAAGPEHR